MYARHLFADVRACVLGADAALLSVRNTILNGPGLLQPSAATLALVNKHFALDKNKKAADSAGAAFFARKDFSYASSATPVARYLTLKK